MKTCFLHFDDDSQETIVDKYCIKTMFCHKQTAHSQIVDCIHTYIQFSTLVLYIAIIMTGRSKTIESPRLLVGKASMSNKGLRLARMYNRWSHWLVSCYHSESPLLIRNTSLIRTHLQGSPVNKDHITLKREHLSNKDTSARFPS